MNLPPEPWKLDDWKDIVDAKGWAFCEFQIMAYDGSDVRRLFLHAPETLRLLERLIVTYESGDDMALVIAETREFVAKVRGQ